MGRLKNVVSAMGESEEADKNATVKTRQSLVEDTSQLIRLDTSVVLNAQSLYKTQLHRIFCQCDVLFAGLLITEWLSAILVAMIWSPRAWAGTISNLHIHVPIAVWLGLAIISLPLFLVIQMPGRAITRHVIAVAQMIMTSLLIHLTGGRIETHFLVFATLAFLSFYRDWKVLVSATVVVAIDHFIRGIWFPMSIYGQTQPQIWRTVEHSAWVLFGDIFFVNWCLMTRKDMWEMAKKHARLENTKTIIETEVAKRTAEARAEKDRFQTLCSSAPVTIFETDNHGSWTYVGNSWSDLTGLESETALKAGWQELIHAEDKTEVIASWHNSIEYDTNWECEFRVRDVDGKIKWVHGEAMKCPSSPGMPIIYIGSLMDISDHKMAESTSRRLELIQQKEDFLATLSHDLKNPIIGTNRILELILNGKLGPVSKEINSVMVKLKESNSALLEMIQNLISIYRYDTGADFLTFEFVDLVPKLRRVMGEFTLLANDKEVELHFDVENVLEENYSVLANRHSLVRLFSNLLDNALKFTPSKGKVTVTLSASEQHVKVVVKNTGSYIDEDTKNRLFNRFYQGQEGRNYVAGTGLGLYICSQIVRAHNAQISCESSSDNAGETSFIVVFESEKHLSSGGLEKLSVQSSTQHDEVHNGSGK